MRAVDTNLLVRLIVRDDPKQVEAAEAFVAGGAWVPQLVMAETIWVLDAVHERSAGHLPFGSFDRGLSRLEGAERL